MLRRFIYALLVSLVIIECSSSVIAFQVSVEDVSNQKITCDSPLLDHLPPDTCVSYPEGTLFITVELDEDEDTNLLENVHVVIQGNDDQYYQYNTVSGNDLWQKVVNGIYFSSFRLLPFEIDATSIGRQVHLGEFASQQRAKIFIGLRANSVAGFVEGSIKEVFEIQ